MKNKLFTCLGLVRLFLLTTVGLLLAQCENGDKMIPTVSGPTSSLSVSPEYATKIATAFNSYPENKKARIASDGQSTISQDSLIIETTEIYSDGGNNIFHVLNYKNNKGWLIISADRRVTPILAYSYIGKFDTKNLGDGTKAWVEGVTRLSKGAQTSKLVPSDMIEARWRHYEKSGGISTARGRVGVSNTGQNDASNCSSYDQYMHQCPTGNIYANPGYPNSTLVGSWGNYWRQNYGYAYSMPSVDGVTSACANCANNTLTGCGPLAIAMVMRANNINTLTTKPIDFNFDIMTTSIGSTCDNMSPGEIELSKLIHFSYYWSNADSVPTSCNVFTEPGNIPTSFSRAGYSNSGSMQDFQSASALLKSDLHQGYPVVMSGMTCGTCLGTWHIWVVDGFHEDTFYNLDCSGSSPVCQESGFLFYSVKWGNANSNGSDGWYAFDNFSQGGDHYTTNLKVNVGARP